MLQQMRSAAKWIWIFIVIAFVGGFLFVETSGLLGRDQVTTSSVVASVNGVDIPYLTWVNASNQLAQQREQQTGRGLNGDERRAIEQQAFDQLVTDILLQQEYRRRGIRVSDEEVIQQARSNPPAGLLNDPTLQTDGRFDIEKYQRLLASPQARQSGILLQLENYYRSEIPRAKLEAQVLSEVFISDAKLWSAYRDEHDSAQVSFVSFDPTTIPDSAAVVPEADIRRYYDQNRDRFERRGRAVLSLLVVPRTVTAVDSAATRSRMDSLRAEILGGAKFEDVAARESDDTFTQASGGLVGWRGRGSLDPEVEKAAFALRVGDVSTPVLGADGYHLLKVDSRKSDSINVRHILKRIAQTDSNALRTDRRADSLSRIAAAATDPQRFDSAARVLGLTPERVTAVEDQPLFTTFGVAAGVSAWAFGGSRPRDVSDLFDSDEAYYLARLDSLIEGGTAPFEDVRADIRGLLLSRRKADLMAAQAASFTARARETTLETAARERDLTVTRSNPFSRSTFVPGLGRLNAAIGAAFSLPIGAISEPMATDDGVFVIRVDRRVEASREAFEAQKAVQRASAMNILQQARIREFMEGLRERANIRDRRKQLSAAARAQAAVP
ncbi:MAG: peptidyl-prolyl cis-trans isomerase [Gemmatimonadaceae bacterium]|nr:peptidyl-prolyl cis-trans isomerase [Gemmatimonadaceae bacterium]